MFFQNLAMFLKVLKSTKTIPLPLGQTGRWAPLDVNDIGVRAKMRASTRLGLILALYCPRMIRTLRSTHSDELPKRQVQECHFHAHWFDEAPAVHLQLASPHVHVSVWNRFNGAQR